MNNGQRMERYLSEKVLSDLSKKMVFLTGARQVGKTTLAKEVMQKFKKAQYLNWDVFEDQRIISNRSWWPDFDLLVLDEIHKMRDWKMFLKGICDSRREGQAILVTGSARLETYRQAGESLAGRYFHLRLHPFSVKEWMDLTGADAEEGLSKILER
ncbi:MAG: hypothetical protein BWK80_41150, partial [Desulfobacteraceae bacterium IS3]